MTIKLGVVMDPIAAIHYEKDTTLAMLWEAQKRGWEINYMEQSDIFFRGSEVFARSSKLTVFHDENRWFELAGPSCIPISEFDVILMRKDPPFNLEYIYTTYLLEHAENAGVLVINNPRSLRDVNEKIFTTWFPQCCPPMLVTRDMGLLKDFFQEQKDIVCKPPNGMGGASIFRLKYPDENASVIFEVLTQYGLATVIAQRYIPSIHLGDKRIIMIDGEPIPYALARIPAPGELRGNLAAGGHGVAQPLTERDRFICQQVGPVLQEKGIYFAGLDVIGDFLTEVNVTSPTCVRELDVQCGINISAMFLDCVERRLNLRLS